MKYPYSLPTLLIGLFTPPLVAVLVGAWVRPAVFYAILLWIPVSLLAIYVFTRRP